MAETPNEAILQWAARAIGAKFGDITVQELHEGIGPWRLRVDSADLILRMPVPNWINAKWIATNATALQFAEKNGLAVPHLTAADLDGRVAGTVATLETVQPGSSAPPPRVSAERLREAGAAIAKVHAISLASQEDLPLRIRHTQVDDHALERRWATLYQATPEMERPAVIDAFLEFTTGHSIKSARDVMTRTRLTPLLHLADERVRAIGVPKGQPVFLHGDIWAGNMLWEGDTCRALIDWKTAGAGDPGVDLGQLRMQMALQYGPDAPALVLEGWQREAGRNATNLAYWDAMAALNTPAELDGPPGFDDRGAPVDLIAVTNRRDTFLRSALDALGS